MRIGASLFLIAVGAILKWAITTHVNGINLQVVGVILMIIGIIGLAFDLIMWGTRRRTVIERRPAAPYVAGPGVVERQPGVTYVSEPGTPLEHY